ncbi:MAG: DUF2934 domain-containing protein [Hyphomicrobiales bacterium]|nr:DUF2934 domain-containing protein [Hyphomicrobiales bacterium]
MAAQPNSQLFRLQQKPDKGFVDTQIHDLGTKLWNAADKPAGEESGYMQQAKNRVLGLEPLIRERARLLWEQSGKPDGQGEVFWRQAKEDVYSLKPLVEERAYYIWERAGKPEGQSEANWNQAQAEIDSIKGWIEARSLQMWREDGRPAGEDGSPANTVTYMKQAMDEIQAQMPKIATRAEELFHAAGQPEGKGFQFWRRAENEILLGHENADDPIMVRIEQKAKEIWQQEGGEGTVTERHWKQAEQSVFEERVQQRTNQLVREKGVDGNPEQTKLLSEQARSEIAAEDAMPSLVLGSNGEWRISGSFAQEAKAQNPLGSIDTKRPDGTMKQTSPADTQVWRLFGSGNILSETMARAYDRATGQGPRGIYPQPGDLVDSVYHLPLPDGVTEGSQIILNVQGKRVTTRVIRMELPDVLNRIQYVIGDRAKEAANDGLIGSGPSIEKAYRWSQTVTQGQTRWNTPGISIDAQGARGKLSALGRDISQSLPAESSPWTNDFAGHVRNYLAWADQSADPNIRDKAIQTRHLLADVLLRIDDQPASAEMPFTALHKNALQFLLTADQSSKFTAFKTEGVLSKNGAALLNVLDAQLTNTANNLTAEHWTARMAPDSASPLTAGNLTNDGNAKWTEAGQQAAKDYIQQGLASTDLNVKALAEAAESIFKSRQTRSGKPVTDAQATALLALLKADAEAAWTSGLALRLHPTFMGDKALSPSGRDLADMFAAYSPEALWLELHGQVDRLRNSSDDDIRNLAGEVHKILSAEIPEPGTKQNTLVFEKLIQLYEAVEQAQPGSFALPDRIAAQTRVADPKVLEARWGALRNFVENFAKSQYPTVKQVASELLKGMPTQMPKLDGQVDAQLYRKLLDLMAADQASAWRVSDPSVDWQSVFRTDRSTLSQWIQDHPSVLATKEVIGVAAGTLVKATLGWPISFKVPIPVRQAYMEWSSRRNNENGTGFIHKAHPNDQKLFPNGDRPNLIYDPEGDPMRPWVMASPMEVKVTSQTESGIGMGVSVPFIIGGDIQFVRRNISYLGSYEGKAGYWSIEPMRLTDQEASFIEIAFRGGVNHYGGEGKRAGPVWDGEYKLYRNYKPIPVISSARLIETKEWWRTGIFDLLPRRSGFTPSRVQDRSDRSVAVGWGFDIPHVPATAGTAEFGKLNKYLTDHTAPIRPHPDASPEARALMETLAVSKRKWTGEAKAHLDTWIRRSLESDDPALKEAAEWADKVFVHDFALSRQEKRQMLSDVQDWVKETGDGATTKEARKAQLLEAKLLVRELMTLVEAETLNRLLIEDVRVHQ